MENQNTFAAIWDQTMTYGAYALIVVAVLVLLYHEFRILFILDYKKKYDYVNLNEVKFFWYALLPLVVAAFLFGNTIATAQVTADGLFWFYMRLFITVCFGTVIYFVVSSMVRIYYPRFVEKRLNRLRNKPRKSPAGNLMRKLSEAEEDVHLDASQIAEEASGVHSVDYDVWIDEKTGHKKIEKYFSYQHAEECSECGYFTMKIDREEVETQPTMDSPGVLIKHYKCGYCNHREIREAHIAKLSSNVA